MKRVLIALILAAIGMAAVPTSASACTGHHHHHHKHHKSA
jgi:hypothetical protein